VAGAVELRFLLDPAVQLDREVDADAEQDGQAGDGHDGQRDAEVARQPERPDQADRDDAEGQQPPPHRERAEQQPGHDQDADAAEGEEAPAQVVVDVPEQHGGTGGHHRGVVEGAAAHRILDRGRAPALVLDRRVALEPDHHLGVAVLREERPQRLPDRAGVVVQQEVDPRPVGEGALGGRNGVDPLEGSQRVGEPCLLGRGIGVAALRPE
jgi:hypothetical protein